MCVCGGGVKEDEERTENNKEDYKKNGEKA